jgi:hypothetical protein
LLACNEPICADQSQAKQESTSISSSAGAGRSRLGHSHAAVAREIYDALTAQGYAVFVQDYDIRLGDSFIEDMHEAIKYSRDLIILCTRDYEASAYTRKEFTSFAAQVLQDLQRRIVVLRLRHCSGLWPTMSIRT